MTQTVLLAGATGMLGSRIARRLLVRGGDAGKRATRSPLLARGAEIAERNLADRAALNRATQGVDVIASAVQGGPDVIIDGQAALAEAGRLAMLTGQTALSDPQNDRHPGLTLERLAPFAAQALPRRAAA